MKDVSQIIGSEFAIGHMFRQSLKLLTKFQQFKGKCLAGKDEIGF